MGATQNLQETVSQQPLMMFIPIADEANVDKLTALFTNLAAGTPPPLDFGKSPNTHFARFVVLKSGGFHQTENRLLFTANYDGDRDAYLTELSNNLGTALNQVWQACGVNASDFPAFVDRCSAPVNTFYVALPGVSVRNILSSAAKRQALDAQLDTQTPPGTPSLSHSLPPTKLPAPQPLSLLDRIGQALQSVAEWVVGIRSGQQDAQAVVRTQTGLSQIEDLFVQNQMTVIVQVKKRRLSRLILPIVLWAVNRAAKGAKGSLSGITTIHFARWTIIDGGDNLLFESNYDGSWESYIDDFVDSASVGMNLIWGNCTDFPLGGSRDVEAFKSYIRENQIPSQLFYSAYQELTMTNILTDLGLSGEVPSFARPNAEGQFKQGVYVHG